MDMRDAVKRTVFERQGQALAMLRDMVNTDSCTHDVDGVNAICDMCSEFLDSLGFHTTRYPQRAFGDHLYASKHGSLAGRGGKNILLVGHMDTVFEKGTASKRPYRVDGDIARGPGVHDMKSGLVSALFALSALGHCGFSEFGTIGVLLNSDEEVGSPTSRALIEQHARASDVAFVLECAYPDGSLVTARKGVGMYSLHVSGVAAHAGADHEKGTSAILEMARKIIDIQALTDYSTGTTLNVGVVRGGTRRNVVPESAEAEIDLRVATLSEALRVESALKQIATPSMPGSSVVLKGGLNRPPMERTPQVSALYGLVAKEAATIGLAVRERSTGGASDGNFVGFTGTPVIDGIGPQGGYAHSLDEFMQLSTFPLWIALLSQSIIAVCGL